MDELAKRRYTSEIKLQSLLGLLAVGNLINTIQAASQPPIGWPSEQPPYLAMIFREIHSFLTHASNVSKLFWPIGTKRNNETEEQFEVRKPAIKRGRELRELYDIHTGHALEQRTIRDHLEHYDERLDAYIIDSASDIYGGFGDMILGGDDVISGIRPDFIMRHYNHESGMLIFRGVQYDLVPIISALQDVHQKSLQLPE